MNGKIAAIMQPTYLPWLGYFALMERVDIFVYLDSVQFTRRSWQQRNRIKTANGVQWLTVPVVKKSLRHQLIKEVKIDSDSKFDKKHKRTIELAYKKAPFFKKYSENIFEILLEDHKLLCELNIALIEKIRELIGIDAQIIRSSSLNAKGIKAGLLANICDEIGASTYISPTGSKEYLVQSTEFMTREIALLYNDYIHQRYSQLYGEFVEYMSVIDLLFNEGPKSLDIIISGRKIRP